MTGDEADALLADAIRFASVQHRRQRYGGLPYVEHLAAVALVLRRFHVADPTLLAAAWLHDVVEDTPTTVEAVERRFGPEVADLIGRVTCPDGARPERLAAAYPRIAESDRATMLKLGDRIANVEAAVEAHPRKLAMYRREHPAFRAALYRRDGPAATEAMWRHLDRLLDDGVRPPA